MLIPLSKGHAAIVDSSDYQALATFHWSARKSHSCWYAVRKQTVRGIRRTVFMHKHIAHPPPDFQVHHINFNSLDNRTANLMVLLPYEHRWIHTMNRILRRAAAAPPGPPIQIEIKTGGTPQT